MVADAVERNGSRVEESTGLAVNDRVPERMRDSQPADTLFFDGQCPLCAAEIDALAEARGSSLRLVDIHESGASCPDQTGAFAEQYAGADLQADLQTVTAGGERGGQRPMAADAGPRSAQSPTADELLRTLHLQRADGAWLTGADANVAAWEGTRRGRLLRVLRWPLLRPFVDVSRP